jgi:hypothetical protein
MSKADLRPAGVVIVRESLIESFLNDAWTFSCLVAVIAVGVWIDSSAMQWIGGICWFIAILNRASGKFKRMTIPEARAELDRIESDG